MKEAVKRFPERDFEVPDGIVFVNINKKTGKLSEGDPTNSVYEAFIEGTEPKSKVDDSLIETQDKDANDILEEEEQFFKNGY